MRNQYPEQIVTITTRSGETRSGVGKIISEGIVFFEPNNETMIYHFTDVAKYQVDCDEDNAMEAIIELQEADMRVEIEKLAVSVETTIKEIQDVVPLDTNYLIELLVDRLTSDDNDEVMEKQA